MRIGLQILAYRVSFLGSKDVDVEVAAAAVVVVEVVRCSPC